MIRSVPVRSMFPEMILSRSGAPLMALVLAAGAIDAKGATVSLQPILDTSIYNEGNNSNAKGGLYAGQTATGNIRRALVEFDLAAAGIPSGAVILSASLSFSQIKIGPAAAVNFELHPLLAAWSEGTSSGTGSGASPTSGDATWNFRMFGSNSWSTAGGDFGSTSATTLFGTTLGTYTFNSTAGLVADVQGWVNAPSANHGWILRAANESPSNNSARELGSRESSLAQRPTLTITYNVVPEPGASGLLVLSAVGCSMCRRRRA